MGLSPRRTARSMLVISAGVAGLSAARALRQFGHEVTVLEARNRSGGRVSTLRDPARGLALDMGASWIHGVTGNPIAHSQSNKRIVPRCALQHRAGGRSAQPSQTAADQRKPDCASKTGVNRHCKRSEQVAGQVDRRGVVEEQRREEHPIDKSIVQVPKLDARNAVAPQQIAKHEEQKNRCNRK